MPHSPIAQPLSQEQLLVAQVDAPQAKSIRLKVHFSGGLETSFNEAIKGKRLRCKICRRELAAKEHVLNHSPGQGKAAFASQKRDMKQLQAEIMNRLKILGPNGNTTHDTLPKGCMDRLGGEPTLDNCELESETSPDCPRIDDVVDAADDKGVIARDQSVRDGKSKNNITPVLVRRGIASLRVSVPPQLKASQESTQQHGWDAVDLKSAQVDAPLPSRINHNVECSSYFVEPLGWMSGVLEKGELRGRLVCPSRRCGSKLGSFDWAGSRCSCGAWITPGFQILKSKVDEL